MKFIHHIAGPIRLAVLAGMVFCAYPVGAQTPADSCRTLLDATAELVREPHADDDAYRAAVGTARQALECYGSQDDANIWWLTRTEVEALNHLSRFDEAEHLVDQFLREYPDASPAYLGTMYDWRTRYSIRKGDLIGALDAYYHTVPFYGAMPLSDQIQSTLNLVALYVRARRWDDARKAVKRAEDMIANGETNGGSGMQRARARALLYKGETLLHVGKVRTDSSDVFVNQAIEVLRAAYDANHERADFSDATAALTSLSEAYRYVGDDATALECLNRASALAVDHELPREHVAALYALGDLYLGRGQLDEAERALHDALDVSTHAGVTGYDRRLRLLLGQLYERRDALDQAREAFADVVEASSEVTSLDERDAIEQARAGMIRTLQRSRAHAATRDFMQIIVVFVVGLVLGGTAIAYAWPRTRMARRRAASQERKKPATLVKQPHERIAIPPSDVVRALDEVGEDVPLLHQRLIRLRAVLLAPDEVAGLIDDPLLSDKLVSRQIHKSNEIFRCVGAIEEMQRGTGFQNDPANTIGSYLRREFKIRRIDWPRTPHDWTFFFGEKTDFISLFDDAT